ncbi:MAG TPA: hypothetical protein VK209_09325 [Candidatus Sulfotelmatobacter sp.]|jgi:hypothetical protein|nr:hypothetical protein [Candidatus Sulfotelmatobacter sp.]
MKTIKGWRRIDKERGFMNETTGQSLVIKKKEFGIHYLVMLFGKVEDTEEGRKISPEFSTEAKAEAYAVAWMYKHPEGEN